MAFSLFEARGVRFELSSEEEIANISAPGPKIKKVRPLSFLQLLKFEREKCPQICDLWPRSLVIAIFSYITYILLPYPFKIRGQLEGPLKLIFQNSSWCFYSSQDTQQHIRYLLSTFWNFDTPQWWWQTKFSVPLSPKLNKMCMYQLNQYINIDEKFLNVIMVPGGNKSHYVIVTRQKKKLRNRHLSQLCTLQRTYYHKRLMVCCHFI